MTCCYVIWKIMARKWRGNKQRLAVYLLLNKYLTKWQGGTRHKNRPVCHISALKISNSSSVNPAAQGFPQPLSASAEPLNLNICTLVHYLFCLSTAFCQRGWQPVSQIWVSQCLGKVSGDWVLFLFSPWVNLQSGGALCWKAPCQCWIVCLSREAAQLFRIRELLCIIWERFLYVA